MIKKFLALFVLVIVLSLFAFLPSSNAGYEAYIFESYDVLVVVDEDYTFHVTETLHTVFVEERHGIYRELPNYWGEDRIKYTNIAVSGAPLKIEEGRYYTDLRIGDANKTIIGPIEYEISYTISLPKDANSKIDAVYMNVIGYEHATTSMNANITIELPKKVDPTFISVVTGYYYDTGIEDKVAYEYVDRQTLNITLLEPLENYEGMTVKIDLPQGYFENVKQPFFIDEFLPTLLPLLLLLVGIIIWAIYGNDKRLIIPVVFDLEGISPVEAGYIIDDKIDEEDISSMLIYWASLGFIKIEKGKGKNNYKFYKVKSMTNRPKYEKIIFDNIFKKGDEGKAISTKTMKKRLGGNIGKFRRDVQSKYFKKEDKLMNNKSENFSYLLVFLAYICFGLLGFFLGFRQALGLGIFLGLFSLLFFIPIHLWLKKLLRYVRKRTFSQNIFKFIPFILLILLYGYIINLLRRDIMFSITQLAIMLLSSGLLIVLSYYTQKLSEYGHALYERVLGFRHFLLTAEKSWLETLAEDDPEFFYDRLPYALVLGVSRVWIGKFAQSVSVPPTWYVSTSPRFNARTFSSTMTTDFSRMAAKEAFRSVSTSSYTRTRSSSSYRPSTYSSSSSFSSGSSSSFSGGGFSGGGSSSW